MVSTKQSISIADEPPSIVYPDSDGEPMCDNTLQYDWIVLLKSNLDILLPDDFVGGNILWYPVEGHPETRVGPDVLVAKGRPKGYRGSYIQFREAGVAPTAVFEVLSPSNTLIEMMRKQRFFGVHGAREQIYIDPFNESGFAFVAQGDGIYLEVEDINGWTSPALGIRFALEDGKLRVYRPDGAPFLSPAELAARAEQQSARAEQESARASRLAEKLRALGVDPDAV
ncbi:MAG: Uma2 family endonuclease [Deltaproteobacteria bacterium]|nr:Uma2 family endonuclease [Deltaproteobacteria bacterium]